MSHERLPGMRASECPSGIALMVTCVVVAIALSGCASLQASAHTDASSLSRAAASAPTTDGSSPVVLHAAGEEAELEEYDPWQRFNGKTFEFNRRVDRYALKPIAKGWKAVLPERVAIMLSNAFDNVNVVPRVLNNVLQGRWNGAGRELGRFVINSTAGVGGLFDPAKDYLNIGKSPAEFGQTLGKWGTGPGPYLVLPFMEPLTVRDGIGNVVDGAMNPLSYVLPLVPVRLSLTAGSRVNERALIDDLFQDFEDSVVDTYSAVRNGYLQRREHMIHEQEEHP